VRVVLDPERLAAFMLSAADIRRMLVAANTGSTSGALHADNRTVDVETGQYLANARDVASLVVGAANGNPVYLSDVAAIIDGPPPPSHYVWLGTGPQASAKNLGSAGEFPAVTMAVTKKPGENAVGVANRLMSPHRRPPQHRHPGRRRSVGHAQLRRNGERQGAQAHREARVRHRLGGGTRPGHAWPP
jgi:multidrug efflux pump subunit AcrB